MALKGGCNPIINAIMPVTLPRDHTSVYRKARQIDHHKSNFFRLAQNNELLDS